MAVTSVSRPAQAEQEFGDDADRAASILRAVDRVVWLRIDGDRAIVHAVSHRRPVTLAISIASARSLTRLGVPTVGDRHEGAPS